MSEPVSALRWKRPSAIWDNRQGRFVYPAPVLQFAYQSPSGCYWEDVPTSECDAPDYEDRE